MIRLVQTSYPYLDLDPALVLSVIATESQGFPDIVSKDGWGSVGLMQVIPRSWTGTEEWLKNPWNNLNAGMHMLDASIKEHGLRKGLAAYNCSLSSIEADKCAPYGGYAFADKVLSYYIFFWQPEAFP